MFYNITVNITVKAKNQKDAQFFLNKFLNEQLQKRNVICDYWINDTAIENTDIPNDK
jgi:transposase-like protein